MESAYLVGAGGAIGAIIRFAVGRRLVHERFPVATLTVNIGGTFILALVTAANLHHEVILFIGMGACGSFTTYSSFSFETIRLWEAGDGFRALIYALGTLGLCLLAGVIGFGIGRFW